MAYRGWAEIVDEVRRTQAEPHPVESTQAVRFDLQADPRLIEPFNVGIDEGRGAPVKANALPADPGCSSW